MSGSPTARVRERDSLLTLQSWPAPTLGTVGGSRSNSGKLGTLAQAVFAAADTFSLLHRKRVSCLMILNLEAKEVVNGVTRLGGRESSFATAHLAQCFRHRT